MDELWAEYRPWKWRGAPNFSPHVLKAYRIQISAQEFRDLWESWHAAVGPKEWADRMTLARQYIQHPANEAIGRRWRSCDAPKAIRLLSSAQLDFMYEAVLPIDAARYWHGMVKREPRSLLDAIMDLVKQVHAYDAVVSGASHTAWHHVSKVPHKPGSLECGCGWNWMMDPSKEIELLEHVMRLLDFGIELTQTPQLEEGGGETK